MKRHLIIKVLILVIAVMCFTGCDKQKRVEGDFNSYSKEELVELVSYYTDEIVRQQDRIIELESKLSGVQTTETETAAIYKVSDGTGRLTFNSIDGAIQFPVGLQYPGAEQMPANSSVNLTENIKMKVSDNWLWRLHGTSIELNHISGIQGVIKVGSIKTTVTAEELQNKTFSDFFKPFPASNITYTKVFLDRDCWGVQASTDTTINEQPAFIRCGLIGYGRESISYIFIYSGEQDSTKDELESLLLKTIEIYGNNLKID